MLGAELGPELEMLLLPLLLLLLAVTGDTGLEELTRIDELETFTDEYPVGTMTDELLLLLLLVVTAATGVEELTGADVETFTEEDPLGMMTDELLTPVDNGAEDEGAE